MAAARGSCGLGMLVRMLEMDSAFGLLYTHPVDIVV